MKSAEMKLVSINGDVIMTSTATGTVGGKLFNWAFLYNKEDTEEEKYNAVFRVYHKNDFATDYPIMPKSPVIAFDEKMSEANNKNSNVGTSSLFDNYLIKVNGSNTYVPVTNVMTDDQMKALGKSVDAYNGYYELVKADDSTFYFDFRAELNITN